MRFRFDKPTCQNIRKSLRKEWLETNGLGDYSSSSLICCNTRKYHGLLVTGMGYLENRHVVLSSLEESLIVGAKEMAFSCHGYPQGVYHPHGHEYLRHVLVDGYPLFRYRFGDLVLIKEIMMIPDKRLVVIRYTMNCAPDTPAVCLRIKPMTAFRHFHGLTQENDTINKNISPVPSGFKMQAYDGVPPLYMQIKGKHKLKAVQYWYKNVEYMQEAERGFPSQEDLFVPAEFDIEITHEKPVYVTASTEEFADMFPEKSATIEKIWLNEAKRREKEAKKAETLEGHLALEGERFIIKQQNGDLGVIAGYHWFGVWGRDMFLSLPGLTFYAGREETGAEILRTTGSYLKNGLIPNMYSSDGKSHAYNSADASLTYIWAANRMLDIYPKRKAYLKKEIWPIIKEIITSYRGGKIPFVHIDNQSFLHVGDEQTQLTWMDASVDGKPVTPRHGCPVEINAFWFNALAFAKKLAEDFGETDWHTPDLDAMRKEFFNRFWVQDAQGGYLADTWRENGRDISLRPNQILALSVPYPILYEEYHKEVILRVRHFLLTPFGLRTLAPGSHGYRPTYSGGPAERDGAYHQGTVWPWLLGQYTEALLKSNKSDHGIAAGKLLRTLVPMFTQHLSDAGIGSVSEIFDGDPPHLPNGTIAQAWSVAGCLRLLQLVKMAEPEVYAEWEALTRDGGSQ